MSVMRYHERDLQVFFLCLQALLLLSEATDPQFIEVGLSLKEELPFQMHPRISIRECVHPSVHPLVRNAFVKIAENGTMQDRATSYVVYTALLVVHVTL